MEDFGVQYIYHSKRINEKNKVGEIGEHLTQFFSETFISPRSFVCSQVSTCFCLIAPCQLLGVRAINLKINDKINICI
jgi:hypothetical protein